MLIEEHKFRRLCRAEFGGLEGEKFQEALTEEPTADPVPVEFPEPGSFIHTKKYFIPREEVKLYARLAKEERAPETDLLVYIKPQMREWIKMNRLAMCRRLTDSLNEYNEMLHRKEVQSLDTSQDTDVTIIWETQSPDKVNADLAKNYLRAYGNG